MSPDKILEFVTAVVKKPASGLAAIFLIGLVVHILWTEGRIPGVVGYAKANEIETLKEDVAGLKSEVGAIRIGALETSMFNLQVDVCKLTDDQAALRTEYQRRISSLQSEYRQATATGEGNNRRLGDPYPLPAC